MSIEVKKIKNVNDGEMYNIWTFNNRPLYYLTKNNNPVQVCPDGDAFCEKWPAVEAPEVLPEGFINVDGYLRVLPEFNPIFLDPIINPSDPIPNKPEILQIPTNFPEFKRGIEVYTFDDDDNTSQSFNGDGLTEGNYVWRVLTGPEDNEDDEDDGLTGGQIAGIVLLALGGLGLLIFIIMLIVNSTKKKKKVKFNFMSFQDFIRNN